MTSAVDKATGDMKLARSSLRDQAVGLLRDLVISGKIPAGARINEAELADTMGISRGPLREAIQRVGAEGLIEFRGNRGAFVKEISLEDARLIFEVRVALESAAARRVAQIGSTDAITDLERQVAQLDDCLQSGAERAGAAPDRMLELNNDFHLKILELSQNPYLQRYGSDLHTQLRVARLHSEYSPALAKRAQAEHRKILRAMIKRDEDGAAAAMTDHLTRALGRFETQLVAVDAEAGRTPKNR
jgi:DNA-binding GntR family transcriptional regulator